MTETEHSLQLVEFTIDGRRFALRIADTVQAAPMVEISPLAEAPSIVLGVINYRGAVVPVLDMRRRLGLPSRNLGLDGQLLIARTSRQTLALPVDQVNGVREYPLSAVTPPEALGPPEGHSLAGVVALPDGLAFIHDPDRFLSLQEAESLSQALSADAA